MPCGGNNHDDDGYEVEFNKPSTTMHISNTSKPQPPQRDSLKPLQRDYLRSIASKSSSTSPESAGPIDLDEMFDRTRIGDYASLFSSSDDEESYAPLDKVFTDSDEQRYFSNPNKQLLDKDASFIPGSPFSKPPNKPSNRPNAPLTLAKYASTFSFLLTIGWVGSLFFFAIWNYATVSRMM
jgi:hypothetical protein